MENKILHMHQFTLDPHGGNGVMHMQPLHHAVPNGRTRQPLIKPRKRRCCGAHRDEKRFKRQVVQVISHIRISQLNPPLCKW